MQVHCLYGPKKSRPRLKSEIRKQQYTMTLFDYNHLVHVTVFWQMQKFMCYCTVFALFSVNLRAISEYKPPEAFVWRGDLSEGFLRYEFFFFLGGGGLYLVGYIFGVLRYLNNYFINISYYYLKIFPRFWLAKSSRIIHHTALTDNTLLDLHNSS